MPSHSPSTIVALAKSTHPGPTLGVTVVAVVLGVAVGLEPWRLVLVTLAFLANQASIGLSNDWLDAERDRAVGRTDKPVALGQLSAQTARNAAFSAAAVSILVTVPLGAAAFLAHALFLASAWSYNLGLKRTAYSALPYLISFGLLPQVITLSRPDAAAAAPWAIGAGALLGLAAHFANVLPDLDDDRQTGVRGLPHRLGRRASGILTCAVLAAASALLLVGQGTVTAVQWIGLAVTLTIALAGVILVLTRPPSRVLFRLIILAALINVALLVASGDRLLA